mgnify:CR=1 FL=1
MITFVLSPPVRGRGLKLVYFVNITLKLESPPVRGRGLKLEHANNLGMLVRSPPVRERGLKLTEQMMKENYACRPPCGGVD